MIEPCGRRAMPVPLTDEDWQINMYRLPDTFRWIYLGSDTADASLMFAYVDQREDWRREQRNRESIDKQQWVSP